MTSIKQARRATVRRLKSVVSMCFLSLLHLKPPHDGCPSQYNHTTRMSGSFDSKRFSGMSGGFDSQRMSKAFGSFDSPRTSKAFGSFDSPRVSRVYGGYESRRASKFICECNGYEIAHPDNYNLPVQDAISTYPRISSQELPPPSLSPREPDTSKSAVTTNRHPRTQNLKLVLII